jgi:hypothetical protein
VCFWGVSAGEILCGDFSREEVANDRVSNTSGLTRDHGSNYINCAHQECLGEYEYELDYRGGCACGSHSDVLALGSNTTRHCNACCRSFYTRQAWKLHHIQLAQGNAVCLAASILSHNGSSMHFFPSVEHDATMHLDKLEEYCEVRIEFCVCEVSPAEA